jgi:pyruvate formate lyase activating enzyme
MSMGYVNSVEVGSFVDGPGTRYVVFLSGCPLRCQYCHNPDAWACRGEPTDARDVVDRIARTAEFLRSSGGGVTISGGEPLGQPQFTYDILAGAKHLGLHTALDTSGYLGDRIDQRMLDVIDLVLLDIKSWDRDTYRDLTGVELEPTLRLARRLAEACKPTWIRFVLVPGLTDDPTNVEGLATFIASLGNVERVDVIPFHQMGQHKWKDLGLEYRLSATEPPTPDSIERVKGVFRSAGLPVDIMRFLPCGPEGRASEGDER